MILAIFIISVVIGCGIGLFIGKKAYNKGFHDGYSHKEDVIIAEYSKKVRGH